VAREGRDISIITYAAMVHIALEAAEILAREGIELEILDLRTLLPLDEEAIATTVRRTNRVIILHEDTKTGGIAGEISAIINERAFDDLDGPIIRITARDTPVPFSPPLEEYFLPKVEDIVREARRLKAY
jgi:2-oxoisovalerate dehydrogenase E1 component beta subunit